MLQVLLVDHGLQGGVHLEGERLTVLLHSAGGGQLGGGGFCAVQVAQVQRVGVDRCSAGGVTPSAGGSAARRSRSVALLRTSLVF